MCIGVRLEHQKQDPPRVLSEAKDEGVRSSGRASGFGLEREKR